MAKEVAKDEVINATITALAFVKKPKPAAKYLATPPFRYIYDLVIAVINETGFPRGLFSAEQMAFPQNVAKEQKVAFLDRLITCLGVATGSPLEARPQKICAGMEPDKTNVMLQELGKCAQNTALNLEDILARVNAQIGPPDGAAPAAAPATAGPGAGAAAAADTKAADEAAAAAKAKADEMERAAAAAAEKKQREADEAARKEEEKKKARAEAIAKAQAAAAAAEAKAAAEREEAERKAQADAAAAAASRNAGPTDGGDGGDGMRFDGEVIALTEPGTGEPYVEQTIKLYANLISKPKMAAKLLERPPFRFIQDVVIGVHQRTAFGSGVFTEADLTSDKDNKTESKQKLAYLQKLIDLVGAARGRDLKSEVNPRKVAAGQDAEKTNVLLQELARAAASGVNAQDLARVYNQKQSGTAGDDTAAAGAGAGDGGVAAAKVAAEAAAKAAADERAAAAAAKAEADAAKKRDAEAKLADAKKKLADEKRRAEADAEEQRKKAAAGDSDMPRLPLGALNDGKSGAAAGADSDAGADAPGGAGGDGAPKRAERPRTARRAPPRVKEAHLIDDTKKANNTALPDDAKDGAGAGAGGTGGDAKGNAAGANGANGGAGAGASAAAAAGVIKEDDKGAAEEPDSEPDEADQPLWKQDSKAGAADNKDAGKLLSAILKAQDNGADGKAMAMRVGSAKAGAAAQSKLMSTEQLQALRAAVQKVCQSANPLGKCIDFVSEDMDGMGKELVRWKRAYAQYNEKFEEEKQHTQAVLAPLQAQIKAADAALAAQMRKIHTLKASILRNDQIIASAIEQHATSV